MTRPSVDYWWAGIVTVLPRGTVIPPATGRWACRWNEFRWFLDRPRVFPWPVISRGEARAKALPTCTGFGDLLCSWMMPIALGDLMGWNVRIPVPRRAGGIHHDPGRAALTPAWFNAHLDLPPHVQLVAAEAAPEDVDWFCTVEPQWYLNSCMETSFWTIPYWLRSDGIDRARYYERYRHVARGLLRPGDLPPRFDGAPYLALHARRGDRGELSDDQALQQTLRALSPRFRHWAVISDDGPTLRRYTALLGALGCITQDAAEPGSNDSADRFMADFRALVGAAGVVSSVKGGWSAFPYAATRISGAPLLVAVDVREARVWRLFKAYSPVAIDGVHVGPGTTTAFEAESLAAYSR
jgi:hypothetical protein